MTLIPVSKISCSVPCSMKDGASRWIPRMCSLPAKHNMNQTMPIWCKKPQAGTEASEQKTQEDNILQVEVPLKTKQKVESIRDKLETDAFTQTDLSIDARKSLGI